MKNNDCRDQLRSTLLTINNSISIIFLLFCLMSLNEIWFIESIVNTSWQKLVMLFLSTAIPGFAIIYISGEDICKKTKEIVTSLLILSISLTSIRVIYLSLLDTPHHLSTAWIKPWVFTLLMIGLLIKLYKPHNNRLLSAMISLISAVGVIVISYAAYHYALSRFSEEITAEKMVAFILCATLAILSSKCHAAHARADDE